ncbi:MAG: hypothetical protein FRX49_01609 [Trebouxia sp. A1-2]|nr:MAG: hypothetical protein FRX49_01609 [Trebouxia sp. A1-2]
MFFHRSKADVPSHVFAAAFELDMWHIRHSKRQKLEAAAAIAHPAPPAQGKLEFIADRVKQRRLTC